MLAVGERGHWLASVCSFVEKLVAWIVVDSCSVLGCIVCCPVVIVSRKTSNVCLFHYVSMGTGPT